MPNMPLSGAVKSLTHRSALLISLIIALPYCYVHKRRAHYLLCYSSVAMAVYKKADRSLFLSQTQNQSIPSPATGKLQKHKLQAHLSSSGSIWQTSQEAAQILLQRQQTQPFNPGIEEVLPDSEEQALNTLQEGCKWYHEPPEHHVQRWHAPLVQKWDATHYICSLLFMININLPLPVSKNIMQKYCLEAT